MASVEKPDAYVINPNFSPSQPMVTLGGWAFDATYSDDLTDSTYADKILSEHVKPASNIEKFMGIVEYYPVFEAGIEITKFFIDLYKERKKKVIDGIYLGNDPAEAFDNAKKIIWPKFMGDDRINPNQWSYLDQVSKTFGGQSETDQIINDSLKKNFKVETFRLVYRVDKHLFTTWKSLNHNFKVTMNVSDLSHLERMTKDEFFWLMKMPTFIASARYATKSLKDKVYTLRSDRNPEPHFLGNAITIFGNALGYLHSGLISDFKNNVELNLLNGDPSFRGTIIPQNNQIIFGMLPQKSPGLLSRVTMIKDSFFTDLVNSYDLKKMKISETISSKDRLDNFIERCYKITLSTAQKSNKLSIAPLTDETFNILNDFLNIKNFDTQNESDNYLMEKFGETILKTKKNEPFLTKLSYVGEHLRAKVYEECNDVTGSEPKPITNQNTPSYIQ